MNKKNLFKVGVMVAMVALVAVAVAPAALADTLPNPTPPITGEGISVSEVMGLINQIARWLIAISLVVATIMIIWGAIQVMVKSGEEATVANAWGKIKGGVLGAVIALGVGVILQTIANIVNRSALQ